MPRTAIHFFLFLIVALFANTSLAIELNEQMNRETIILQVELPRMGSPTMLKVRLTNKSDSEIEIPNSQLPWGDRHSMLFVGIDPSGRRSPFGIATIISVPVTGKTRIAAGETISGTVNLTYHIERLHDHLSEGDVLVFWNYKNRIGGVQVNQTGSILLPQSTKKAQ